MIRLLALGVHPNIVQELLGHRDITTTLNIHGHLIPGLKESAASKLNQLFTLQPSEISPEKEETFPKEGL